MHEYSIVGALIEQCEQHARDNNADKVTRVAIILKRNEQYWDNENTTLDQVTFLPIENQVADVNFRILRIACLSISDISSIVWRYSVTLQSLII